MSSQYQAHGPRTNVQEMLVLLSVKYDRYDIAQLSQYFRSHTEEAVVNDFVQASGCLSVSDRSSLRFSLFSTISSTPRTSIGSRSYSPNNFDQCHNPQRFFDESHGFSLPSPESSQYRTASRAPSQHHQQYSPLGQVLENWQPRPGQNNTSSISRSSFSQIQTILQVCTACNTCYKGKDPKSELERHHREKCEKKEFWICRDCPSEKQSHIQRRDRLRKHHLNSHTNICNICPKFGKASELSTECKAKMESFKQDYPKKKAWGCPRCLACFHSVEEWREHEIYHQTEDVEDRPWSSYQMITSLLLMSKLLRLAASQYDWKRCTWPEESYENVRFALERQELPEGERTHPRYISLSVEEALVRYAYEVGSSGSTFPHMSRPHDMESVPSVPKAPKFSKEQSSINVAFSPKAMDVDQPYPEQNPGPLEKIQVENQSFLTSYHNKIIEPIAVSQHMPLGANALKTFDQAILDSTGKSMPIVSRHLIPQNQENENGRQRQFSHSSPPNEPKRLKLQKSFQKLVQRSKGSKYNNPPTTTIPPRLPSIELEPALFVNQIQGSIERHEAPDSSYSLSGSMQHASPNIHDRMHADGGFLDMDQFTTDTPQLSIEPHVPEEYRPTSAGGFYDSEDDDFEVYNLISDHRI